MSLIKCPECDHNVSSKAPFCPNCGVLIEGNIKRCPVCGGYSLMAATQCPHCQTKFAAQQPAHTPPAAPVTPRRQATSPTDSDVSTKQPAAQTSAHEPDVTQESQLPDTHMVDPRAPQQKSDGAPWYLLILAIILIAIGGFFYWENENQEASEERAYELLRDCNDPLNYEDFIARYPMSRHIDDVRARLNALHRENEQWLSVIQKNDVSSLQDFISSHPTSPYKATALHKIDSLEWRQAEHEGTAAAYDLYIKRHDNGAYIDQAYQAHAAARQREEQARRDSMAAAQTRQRDSIAAAQTLPNDVVAPE